MEIGFIDFYIMSVNLSWISLVLLIFCLGIEMLQL